MVAVEIPVLSYLGRFFIFVNISTLVSFLFTRVEVAHATILIDSIAVRATPINPCQKDGKRSINSSWCSSGEGQNESGTR